MQLGTTILSQSPRRVQLCSPIILRCGTSGHGGRHRLTHEVIGRYGVFGVTDAQLHKRALTWSLESCEPCLANAGQRAASAPQVATGITMGALSLPSVFYGDTYQISS